MNINTAYNFSLGCIIVVFFIAAYVFGSYFHTYEKDDVMPEPKQTSFTLSKQSFGTKPSELDGIRDTEVCSYAESAYYYDIPLSDGQQDYVFEKCTEFDLPCELVFAVMGAESGYSEYRVSDNGDYGIMQINSVNHPQLARELGITDFLDFEQNVLCGVYMLSHYYHLYADFNKIAMCYRYGESRATQLWEQGIYETDYTRKIVRVIAGLEYR